MSPGMEGSSNSPTKRGHFLWKYHLKAVLKSGRSSMVRKRISQQLLQFFFLYSYQISECRGNSYMNTAKALSFPELAKKAQVLLEP